MVETGNGSGGIVFHAIMAWERKPVAVVHKKSKTLLYIASH